MDTCLTSNLGKHMKKLTLKITYSLPDSDEQSIFQQRFVLELVYEYMTFIKELHEDRPFADWYVASRAYMHGHWMRTRYATHTGELLQYAGAFIHTKEQAEFLMSQIPDTFPLV